MSKTLLSRIEWLEQASIATADAVTVILVDFADAPLSGYRWKDAYIERRADETEDALHGRAIAAIPLEAWGGRVMREIRLADHAAASKMGNL